MRTGLAEKLQKLRKTAAIKFIVDAVAPPPRANRPKYRRRLVPATLSPESSLCSRSKTAYACLKLRFVLDAFSYSPASQCTFLRSVSFVLTDAARHFRRRNELSNTAVSSLSRRSPPNNKTNNIQLCPGISITAYSF